MHHRFPIKDSGNDGVNEIQSVNRAMKDALWFNRISRLMPVIQLNKEVLKKIRLKPALQT